MGTTLGVSRTHREPGTIYLPDHHLMQTLLPIDENSAAGVIPTFTIMI